MPGYGVEGWLPRLDVIKLPAIDAKLLVDVVHRKKSSARGIDVWRWKEFKTLPFLGFMALLPSLVFVDADVWPEGLLDAYIATIPLPDGDATPLGQCILCAPCST